jgi:hypothetical protein
LSAKFVSREGLYSRVFDERTRFIPAGLDRVEVIEPENALVSRIRRVFRRISFTTFSAYPSFAIGFLLLWL